jgi:hypothetical protein
MILHEFKALPKEGQIEALWHLGIPVSERDDDRFLYVLFCLDSFYVELKYYGDLLINLYAFKNTEPLEPYLNSIGIPDVTLYR